MKVLAPVAAATVIAATVLFLPDDAAAQIRIARPRVGVVVQPPLVVRPRATVFVGGFYYPSLYRAGLYYGGYPRYYYGGPFYQWPFGHGAYDLSGSLRLQVEPRETEVFIDGYYAGTVDDFDGMFQRLNIEPGDHDVELYLPGHRTFLQRVYVQPGRTFRLRHGMEPLGPGEAPPARPVGAPLPGPGPQGPGPGGRGPGPGPNEPRAPNPGSRDFGQLSLRVQPADAEVLIDGERWEGGLENERLVVQLGAGLHRIEIRKTGYRSYFTDITLRGGETTTLNVALTANQQP